MCPRATLFYRVMLPHVYELMRSAGVDHPVGCPALAHDRDHLEGDRRQHECTGDHVRDREVELGGVGVRTELTGCELAETQAAPGDADEHEDRADCQQGAHELVLADEDGHCADGEDDRDDRNDEHHGVQQVNGGECRKHTNPLWLVMSVCEKSAR